MRGWWVRVSEGACRPKFLRTPARCFSITRTHTARNVHARERESSFLSQIPQDRGSCAFATKSLLTRRAPAMGDEEVLSVHDREPDRLPCRLVLSGVRFQRQWRNCSTAVPGGDLEQLWRLAECGAMPSERSRSLCANWQHCAGAMPCRHRGTSRAHWPMHSLQRRHLPGPPGQKRMRSVQERLPVPRGLECTTAVSRRHTSRPARLGDDRISEQPHLRLHRVPCRHELFRGLG